MNPIRNHPAVPRRLLCWLVAVAFILTINGCGKQQESKEQVGTKDINQVMTEHTVELMAIPGVTGVAIGQLDNGTPCILVLVEQETKDIDQKVPKLIEGHPVKILVSGKIVPMEGK